MAVISLNILEPLRAWKAVGIHHFLGEASCFPHNAPVEEPAAHFSASEVSTPEQPAVVHLESLPLAQWPQNWRNRFSQTRPAPLIWTYKELGDDLAGHDGARQRSDLLKNFMRLLQLPKGSSAFWPVLLPKEAVFSQAEAPGISSATTTTCGESYFFAGLELLRPRAVIVFGLSTCTLSGLKLKARFPFTQEISAGVLYIILPEMGAFISSSLLFEKSLAYLRTTLHGIIASLGHVPPAKPGVHDPDSR